MLNVTLLLASVSGNTSFDAALPLLIILLIIVILWIGRHLGISAAEKECHLKIKAEKATSKAELESYKTSFIEERSRADEQRIQTFQNKAAAEIIRFTESLKSNQSQILESTNKKLADTIADIIKTKQELCDLQNQKEEILDIGKIFRKSLREISFGSEKDLSEQKKMEHLATQYHDAAMGLYNDMWMYLKMYNAPRADERLREEHRQRIDSEKERNYLKGVLSYYERLAPWLKDTIGPRVSLHPFVSGEFTDSARNWINQSEYEKMSEVERNQLALDRYRDALSKTNWQIGRDYEQYIGWKYYESRGWNVKYDGMIQGFDDLGRDLICEKDGEIHIVQCKRWSSLKQIREAHINQLFGTYIQYASKHQCKTYLTDFSKGSPFAKMVTPVFFTTTELSTTAKHFASCLKIKVCYVPFDAYGYPLIKCNQRSGNKIYHLPFDQMYDRTIIDESQGDFYAFTVAEAEAKGFRRALHWSGNMTPSQC